jgi:predicted ArsR family transcriptional regulator
MNIEVTDTTPLPAKPQATKSELVRRLLSRKTGATINELTGATSWQPHSVRAYLTGLRKKGSLLTREERRDGSKAYRLNKAAESQPQ